MKLDAVTVKNFRGYGDEQTVSIGPLTTIVGRNDVGKSTILEALALFFGSDVIKPDVGDLNVQADSKQFTVSCTFSDLPPQVVLDAQATTSLAAEFLLMGDGRLKITKRWDCAVAKPKEEVFVTCEHPSADEYSDLLSLGNSALKARLGKLLSDAQMATVNKASNPSMRQALWEFCSDLKLTTQDVPVAREDSKRIWERLSAMLPHFALFQSDRASRDSDDEVQDPMKLAITAALAQPDVQKSLASVVEAVRVRATELATRTHAALGELDPELAEGLVPTFKSDPRWAGLFTVALQGDDGIPINKRGSGVRRLILVSFFRAEARRQMEEGSKQSVIYAIEEPETSQHPRNQKILLDAFQQMTLADGCQVLLTTHSPGLAGHLPVDSLRFVSKSTQGSPQVEPASADTWETIANELGILPDDRVRVLICVEGPHDVVALKALSRALFDAGESVPDLSADKRFAFVPLGGGTLQQWVAERYLQGFGRPEFHLYDRDVKKYEDVVAKVNARTDGSSARRTLRFEMENYLHPQVIEDALEVAVSFGPDDDVPSLISSEIGADATRKSLNSRTIKTKLAEHAFPRMTKRHLDASGGTAEVKSWLDDLERLAVSQI